MSLYQKYRPKDWDDFIGAESEVASLEALLTRPDHPRVFLFSGPAGCGKTSMARVLASKVGSTDVIEINSADNRGIDTARTIIDDTQFILASPRVYVLDEVHQTSKDFQNAMLKALEDTPPNVYFVLCSSEPNKIITAVKSRCTEIQFKALSQENIITLCRRVSKAEGHKLDIDVLEAIAESANGSARTALVILEKVFGVEPEKALDIIAQGMIQSSTLEVCRLLLSDKVSWPSLSKAIQALEVAEWESPRYAVLGYMSSVLLKGGNDRAAMVMEEFSEPFYNSGKAGFILACYKVYRFGRR